MQQSEDEDNLLMLLIIPVVSAMQIQEKKFFNFHVYRMFCKNIKIKSISKVQD
jgi:hypothetical protein